MQAPLLNALLWAASLAGAVALPQSCPATDRFQQSCAALASKLLIPNATVTTTEFVPANTTLVFNPQPTCRPSSQLVTAPLCRVQANISTSSSSSLRFEAWLPQNWTGRFLSTGNGGLGGCIQYEDVEWAASLGFASVATNNGKDGTSGAPFLNRPEVVEDFVYRAVRTGIVVGKSVTQAFYGRPHTKSYYLGCSTGGRQGMKMVQDFPDSFDGVAAGAPAINFNNLNAWSAHFLPVTGLNTSDTFVNLDLWTVVNRDILNKCDGLDGQVDGILEAPDLCRYTADSLLCGGPDGAPEGSCLTAKQVQTVNEIFSDMTSVNGTVLYPRMNLGAEVAAFSTYYNGQPSDKSDWLKYVVLSNPDFNLSAFTRDLWTAPEALNPFDIATNKADLSAFRNRGGKLLHYHGLMDPIISSDMSPRYYESVSKAMRSTPAQLDDFYRYFRISGMAHCRAGPGAHFIGNTRAQLAYPDNPEDSLLMSLVRWVERGEAPDVVKGVAFVNDTAGGAVSFTRNHCRWPLMNKYQSGDPNDASSWSCVSYNATA